MTTAGTTLSGSSISPGYGASTGTLFTSPATSAGAAMSPGGDDGSSPAQNNPNGGGQSGRGSGSGGGGNGSGSGGGSGSGSGLGSQIAKAAGTALGALAKPFHQGNAVLGVPLSGNLSAQQQGNGNILGTGQNSTTLIIGGVVLVAIIGLIILARK